jgi:DMSO/TMAO reductase YedYZ molybdopterin-dependent catalytic subunit
VSPPSPGAGAPVREVPADWRLEVSDLVADKTPWTLEKLRSLPNEAQVTRHICIEGWSQIGQWSGVPLHVFLQRVGADLRARYVSFKCIDGYSTSIDMPSALHPQTILALDFVDKPLSPEWGAPVRLRIPTKLGFKSAKNIRAISVTKHIQAATGKTRATTGSRGHSGCPCVIGIASEITIQVSRRPRLDVSYRGAMQ